MDTLNIYLSDLRKLSPPLDREREVALGGYIQRAIEAERRLRREDGELTPLEKCALRGRISQGLAARNILVEANLALVVHIGKQYTGHAVGLSDLIQAGSEGLIIAASKFDPEKDCRFATYATWWVRQRVSRAITGQSHAMHIPARMQFKVMDFLKGAAKLAQQLGRSPTPEELAEELDLSPYSLDEVRGTLHRPISLDAPVKVEDEGDTLADLVADTRLLSPSQLAEIGEMEEKLREALKTLPPREAEMLSLFFGLKDGKEWTYNELAEKYGCTRQRVWQLVHKGLERLRSSGSTLRELLE